MYEETKQLTQDEIKTVEQSFKFSAVMYYSDILRFRFDITQFKPNTLYNIEFLDLIPLYNEWYYKYSREFLNLYKKKFSVIKSVGYEDTFLLFLTNDERAFNRLLNLSKMKSYKYKANFTSKERKLIYKLRNSVYYRCIDRDYLSDIEVQIDYLNDVISEIEAQIEEKGARADKLRFGKKLYIQCFLDEFSVLCSEISDLQDDLMEFQDRLNKLEEKYNNLKYGGEDDKTLLDDYSINDYIE